MPSLQFLYNKYKEAQPFKGATIAACLHLEAKTANLLLTLPNVNDTDGFFICKMIRKNKKTSDG